MITVLLSCAVRELTIMFAEKVSWSWHLRLSGDWDWVSVCEGKFVHDLSEAEHMMRPALEDKGHLNSHA